MCLPISVTARPFHPVPPIRMDQARAQRRGDKMKTMARRIQKLEDRLVPAAQTDSSRQLLERIQAGRRRVREYYEGVYPGLSPGIYTLPPLRGSVRKRFSCHRLIILDSHPRSVDLDIPAPKRAAFCGPTRDGNAERVRGPGLAVVGHRDGEGARRPVVDARPAERGRRSVD
jgi:hypothetical protein